MAYVKQCRVESYWYAVPAAGGRIQQIMAVACPSVNITFRMFLVKWSLISGTGHRVCAACGSEASKEHAVVLVVRAMETTSPCGQHRVAHKWCQPSVSKIGLRCCLWQAWNVHCSAASWPIWLCVREVRLVANVARRHMYGSLSRCQSNVL